MIKTILALIAICILIIIVVTPFSNSYDKKVLEDRTKGCEIISAIYQVDYRMVGRRCELLYNEVWMDKDYFNYYVVKGNCKPDETN